MKEPIDVLREFWGYPVFRPMQEDIIRSVLDGRDTLALLPTGGGKSICFQVPTLCIDGLCVVVTPLIALMKDQVEQLRRRKIPAIAIYSGMSHREIDIALDNCIYGNIRFLYVSPERLKTDLFLARAQRMNINLLAIDEAHCISQWGYDFRPPYLEIAEFKKELKIQRLIAVTATATRQVKEDIVAKLELKDAAIFQKSFARPNLSYSVFNLENKEQKLLQILNNVRGTSIVYVRTRRRTKEIADFLLRHNISADYYNGGLPGPERSRKQENWIRNDVRVMVSTNAFGMGIDKPDVRTVVHLDLPDSLEAYYQEAGRAGRDEKMAFAVALYHQKDLMELAVRARVSVPRPGLVRQVYQSLANYFRLAVGSHAMESFPIDLLTFFRTYDIASNEGLIAIKHLESMGAIQFSEGIFEPARLHISLPNDELYRFQVANGKYDVLIKTILRLYGGELFTNFLDMRESDIARLAKMEEQDVRSQLNFLTQTNVLNYKPSTDDPRITFLTPRMHPEDLPIDVRMLEWRLETALEKADAVGNYLESQTKCRTRILQAYFDEITDENCAVCDFCLGQKRNKVDVPLNGVLNLLKSGPQTMQQLRKGLSKYHEDKILQAIRLLVEEDRVKIENDVFTLVNSI
jgi:ATP-dependent DNA helicase RecQ